MLREVSLSGATVSGLIALHKQAFAQGRVSEHAQEKIRGA